MKMGFRDRDVIVEPGEFIIVPHGTEHRPEALDGECHVLMIEPNSTLNTGNVRSEEHTSELQSLTRISYAVFCLKKKTKKNTQDLTTSTISSSTTTRHTYQQYHTLNIC